MLYQLSYPREHSILLWFSVKVNACCWYAPHVPYLHPSML